MKFLFYIAYLVSVSSLPISSLPERHLKPINQSLVGLSNDVESHIVLRGAECGKQVKQLGYYNPQGATDDLKKKDCQGGSSSDCPSSVEECASMVQDDDDCKSGVFMWSESYPVWGCRCCMDAKKPIKHNLWNLYATTASAVQNDVECRTQVKDWRVNDISADECAVLVQEDEQCASNLFMWSSSYPVWGCRCCESTENPKPHNLWNLYLTHSQPQVPTGYMHVAHDRYCSCNDRDKADCGTHRLSNEICKGGKDECAKWADTWSWGSNEQCATSCDDNPDCYYYMWSDNSQCDDCKITYTCATFKSCGITTEFQDGDNNNIFLKITDHYVAQGTNRADAKCTEGLIDGSAGDLARAEDLALSYGSACNEKLVANEEVHGIQCCSDTDVKGFMKNDVDCPYASAYFGKSEKTQLNPYVLYTKKKKQNEGRYWAQGTKSIQEGCEQGTWSAAVAKCASEGGRLCTVKELRDKCADRTGCGYDQRLVWTSDTGKLVSISQDVTTQIQTSQIGAAAIDVAEDSVSPTGYSIVTDLNDKYCCSKNCGEAVLLDTHCDPNLDCDLNQPEALWYSKENCQVSCSNDGRCTHYLWREDSGANAKKTCATFKNCDDPSDFNDGNGGCIYKKD